MEYPVIEQGILGIDETAKSPVIGSVFVAGVLADKQTANRWKQIGVRDSKKLSRKKRERLFVEILKTAKEVKLVEIEPKEIDLGKHLSINDWEMQKVLKLMRMFHQPYYEVQIDNWERTENKFWWRFKKHGGYKQYGTRYVIEHHADKTHVVVSAASIVAKVIYDRQMDEHRLKYGDFGSGNPYDEKTKKFLQDNLDEPPEIIRSSWITFQRMLLQRQPALPS